LDAASRRQNACAGASAALFGGWNGFIYPSPPKYIEECKTGYFSAQVAYNRQLRAGGMG
jgi:hypothetical protein